MARRNLDPDFDIGSRLRLARSARQLSQRELARRAGVTNGLISQIEQNSSSPSVSSLKRILDAIPIAMSDFFAEDRKTRQIFFTAEAMATGPSAGPDVPPALAPLISWREVGAGEKRRLQMRRETYAPGADTGEAMIRQEGELAGLIIAGQIELTVGDARQTLVTGDGFLFDTSHPHRLRNIGPADCILITSRTPPVP